MKSGIIVRRVARELLVPDPEQPRKFYDDEVLDSIGRSLKDTGQQLPLIVYEWRDRLKIADGHQRYYGAEQQQIPELDVIVLPQPPASDELLLLQLTANCLRSDLKPLEKAKAFEQLKKSRGWSNAELADNLHLSKSRITECLSYLTLPEDVQQKIDSGALAGSTAYLIARTKDPEQREAMLAQVRQGRLTRESATRQSRSPRTPGSRITCRLPQAVITVKSPQSLSTQQLGDLWRAILKETRKAESEGFDVPTLERILADRARKQEQSPAAT